MLSTLLYFILNILIHFWCVGIRFLTHSPLSFPNLSTWSERMRLNTNSFITGTRFSIKISDKFIRLYLSKKKITLSYVEINSNSPKILLWGVWNVNKCLLFLLPSRRIRVCKICETKHLANQSGNTSDNLEILRIIWFNYQNH